MLVVDDDDDIRALLGELLGRAGYDVVATAGGRDGLRALYESRPDVVVLDVSMPDLSGGRCWNGSATSATSQS